MPTKRIFTMVIVTSVLFNLAWHGLVKPWGAHRAQQGGPLGLLGSAAVQAS